MSKLNFIAGAKLVLLDQIEKHNGEYWESSTIESEGIYHSHDKDGVFVEAIQGKNIKLYHYPFNLVSVKLEK